MTICAPPVAPWLLQAAALHDTVLVRPLPPVRSGLEQFFFVSSGVASVLTVVLLLFLIAAVYATWRGAAAAGRRMDALLDELSPMIEQATALSASVHKTAELIQQDVASVSEGVQETSARVKHSVGDLADRVDDFNRLLGKVHARADTAVEVGGAAMEGIAWGVKKLRGKRTGRTKKK